MHIQHHGVFGAPLGKRNRLGELFIQVDGLCAPQSERRRVDLPFEIGVGHVQIDQGFQPVARCLGTGLAPARQIDKVELGRKREQFG